jgi:hypothetical protein
MTAAMDFGSNYTANVGATVTAGGIKGIFDTIQKHTSQGYIERGRRDSSIAIATVKEHHEVLNRKDLEKFAEDLAWWAYFETLKFIFECLLALGC